MRSSANQKTGDVCPPPEGTPTTKELQGIKKAMEAKSYRPITKLWVAEPINTRKTHHATEESNHDTPNHDTLGQETGRPGCDDRPDGRPHDGRGPSRRPRLETGSNRTDRNGRGPSRRDRHRLGPTPPDHQDAVRLPRHLDPDGERASRATTRPTGTPTPPPTR